MRMTYDDLPKCCQECQDLDYDFSEYDLVGDWYCSKNIKFPIKKQSCKKQKPWEEREK